ncbi:hypothetical protein HanIR_Chr12g0588741 [Helianthus annuus]|nr:hypothetical protein HanIR_Chr12g0588741 [Helianthus annuus]
MHALENPRLIKSEGKMPSTLLELTRAAHEDEDVERLERLIVKDLQNELASNKDRLAQSHRVHKVTLHFLYRFEVLSVSTSS